MILETIPAIQELTVDQKLRLVCELWTDLSKDASLSPGNAAVLQERLEAYEANPADVRGTDEVTAGILRLKQQLADSRSR